MDATIEIFLRNDGRFGLRLRGARGAVLLAHPQGFASLAAAQACAAELEQAQLRRDPGSEGRVAFDAGVPSAVAFLSGLEEQTLERLGGFE